jgi:hypothetical protein
MNVRMLALLIAICGLAGGSTKGLAACGGSLDT